MPEVVPFLDGKKVFVWEGRGLCSRRWSDCSFSASLQVALESRREAHVLVDPAREGRAALSLASSRLSWLPTVSYMEGTTFSPLGLCPRTRARDRRKSIEGSRVGGVFFQQKVSGNIFGFHARITKLPTYTTSAHPLITILFSLETTTLA